MPAIELGLENLLARLASAAVYAIGPHHEVVLLSQTLERRSRLAVVDGHAELLAPRAQDRQQASAADGGEAMPAGREHLPMEVHVDVIPDRKVLREPLKEISVGLLDAAKRLIREDDAEPERIVGGVPLPDLDPVVRVEELDQGGQIQTRRPASDDRDVELRVRGRQLPSRSRKRCSLPVAVRGSASANSITRGYL